MQFIIKTGWILLFIPFLSKAQSTYLPQGHKHQSFLNRVEIKLQKHPDLNITTIKPLSRRIAVNAALEADSAGILLSATDKNELNSLLLNSKEWVNENRPEFRSKKSFLNAFYESKGNFLRSEERRVG